jgi:protein SCO1/2
MTVVAERRKPGLGASCVMLSALLLCAAPAWPHDADKDGPPPAGRGTEGAPAEAKPVTVKLVDHELLDQDGNRVRFRSDVVRDRLVVIDMIYTNCPVACPILSGIMARLQERLGDRSGKDVLLISISVDPKTDIPPRLKDYAKRWNARPGWVFLTGQQQRIDGVLRGLGTYAADFTDHSTVVLVGDGRTGRWARFYGFPSPGDLLEKLDELEALRKISTR